jgi:hypothetical protein
VVHTYLVGQDAFAPKAERVSVIRDETFASWAERWSECLAPSPSVILAPLTLCKYI